MSLPLEDALRQCQRHAAVMLDAMGQIPFPLEEKSLQQASPELIRFIDQFLLRLRKLQDTLGTHVLRQFATQILVEPIEDSSFVEVLGLLERRGFLTAKEWALQRSTCLDGASLPHHQRRLRFRQGRDGVASIVYKLPCPDAGKPAAGSMALAAGTPVCACKKAAQSRKAKEGDAMARRNKSAA